MKKLVIERVNYFTGEALLTSDFQCEQDYFRDTDAIARSSLYTYGIAYGLTVTMSVSNLDPTLNQVEVSPGVAIDAAGRQIILTEAQVLALRDIENGASYFITISYHEVFGDYSDATGTAGYKRVIEQPELRYARNIDQPGKNILLAVVSFAANGAVNSLSYKSGQNQRRYVAASVGAVNFVTEGAGVGKNLLSAEQLGANLLTSYASIRAKRDSDSSSYLEFNASRGQFLGALTTRSSVGIGVNHPTANLQIDAVTFSGAGTIVSNDTQVTFVGGAPNPFLCPGDTLTALASVNSPAQSRKVLKVLTPGRVLQVDSAFKTNLIDTPYSYMRAALARFSASDGNTCLLQVLLDGSVGLGVQAAIKSGDPAGPNALVVSPDRRVGIALNSGVPQATLDVNGPIHATSLNASGAIKAQSFEGNGSKLEGMARLSFWTKEDPAASWSNLYYDTGNVGIMTRKPQASLSVGGGQAFIGNGVLSSLSDYKLVGFQTNFLDQIRPGDLLAIGTLNNQIAIIDSKPQSDSKLIMQSQFALPVLNSAYSFRKADGVETPGPGVVSSDGKVLNGNGTQFSDLNAGDSIIIPRFTATSTLEQAQKVAQVISDTELTIAQEFTGSVTDLPYSYIDSKGNKVPGPKDSSITATGSKITGKGTAFTSEFVGTDAVLFTHPVQESSSLPMRWQVDSVQDNNNLTLKATSTGSISFTAANSAFMVSSGLLAQFQANDSNGIVPPQEQSALPPAMLVVSNSDIENPNTVAINVAIDQLDRSYALQVNGNVNFGGNVNLDNLTVETLLAKQYVLVAANENSTSRVKLDPQGNIAASATVQASGVVSSAASVQAPTLYASANVQANGNVYANATTGIVQGQTLQSAQLISTGLQIHATGAAQVAINGTVQMLASRTMYTQADLTVPTGDGYGSVQQTWTATTDGMVVALIGSTDHSQSYAGLLTGAVTTSAGVYTCTVYATMTSDSRTFTSKKSSQTVWLPMPGTFTMPVRNGENWTIVFTTNGQFGASPDVFIYWIPFGSNSAATPPSLSTPAPPSAPPPITSLTTGAAKQDHATLLETLAPEVAVQAEPMSDAAITQVETQPAPADASVLPERATTVPNPAEQLFISLMSLANVATNSTSVGQASRSNPLAANALNLQAEIDKRIADLTRVFGDATAMSPDQSLRAAFISDLQKIVCTPDAAGQAQAQQVQDHDQDIQNLIDSFGAASGKTFSAEQRALLDAGVKSLVQINDNEQTRNDLNLIKNNIGVFINSIEQATGITIDASARRVLTRALMRLVGDGRQGDSATAINAVSGLVIQTP
jgi:trimeric autotransporter adhesin